MPIFFVAPELLRLWLGFIPEYADVFLRYIIIVSVIMLFNDCLYTAQNVVGKIKQYSIAFPTMMLLNIIVIYFLFKNGASPVSYVQVLLITYAILAFVIQPILVVRQTEYQFKEILKVFKECFIVTLPSLILPLFFFIYLPDVGDFLRLVILTIISFLSVGVSVWFFGIDYKTKIILFTFIKSKNPFKRNK